MAAPHTNGFGSVRTNGEYGLPLAKDYDKYDKQAHVHFRRWSEAQYMWDEAVAFARPIILQSWAWIRGPGWVHAQILGRRTVRQIRRNLVARRLWSLPHFLVCFWVVAMLWGERWTFESRVKQCAWEDWERWPAEATPHRVVFVADPQLVDPHSYPGRPWPLAPLTVLITDNYMLRAHKQIQLALKPDTTMFLGDLFDGGREWKTNHGDSSDAVWAERPKEEQKLVKRWRRKYGEKYWLKEYARFVRIFYDTWRLAGSTPSKGQRGRKIISSLPGNHDLGFGAEVKPAVRLRFSTYFGDVNRVDVVGNHTFVSVDTVSLSAASSPLKDKVDLRPIYGPAEEFLRNAKKEKRKAVARELKFWRGQPEQVMFDQKVDGVKDGDFSKLPTLDPGEKGADFPTVLLTHVPLHRDDGTPCGPLREHWPPAKPPIYPDFRNAIHNVKGYQYQNMLSEEDSVKLIKSIGNVIHAFSGDDHDYCEVVHSDAQDRVPEITVKSLSMAMGVPTPGFQMVSLWNPIDKNGLPLRGTSNGTLQTHLCLLPGKDTAFTLYLVLAIATLVILAIRAILVPVLKLRSFALDPAEDGIHLPIHKVKLDDDVEQKAGAYYSTTSATSANGLLSSRLPSGPRGSNGSITNGGGGGIGGGGLPDHSAKMNGNGKWSWRRKGGPRIEIRRNLFDGQMRGLPWNATPRANWRTTGLSRICFVWRELWTTVWRVVWMAVGYYFYLAYKG